MKFLIVLALAVACVYAELGITEWKSEYGAYPTGQITALKYAPITPMYYQLAAKPYTIPKGYRFSYDPENFNEAYGFYPEYKK